MTTRLEHTTFSPATCNCIIEEQVEIDNDTNTPLNVSLWFFHFICPKHEPLVKNKPKLSKQQWDKKIKDCSEHHQKLLDANRIRHMKQVDENPQRKRIKEAVDEMKKTLATEKHALLIEAKLDNERLGHERFLDNHEIESMAHLLVGIHSTYAFIGQEVYDAIRQEQAEANPIIENDG